MISGTQQIKAALFDVARQRGMSCVEVAKGAVVVSSENRDRRVLIPLVVFAAKVVFERIVATTQDASVDASRARACIGDHVTKITRTTEMAPFLINNFSWRLRDYQPRVRLIFYPRFFVAT